jgi:chromatin segregation and condensation protein Rec8/ScpA/Scc1 (kleisin family)
MRRRNAGGPTGPAGFLLIVGRRSRSEMVGVFLALLELIREERVLVEQSDPLGEVQIVIAPEEHRRTYVGASLHLSNEEN